MSFNSIAFLIFLPSVLFLYWVFPRKAKKYFLLAASYFFYAYYNVWLLSLIINTTLISYLSALMLSKTDNLKLKKTYMIVSVLLCLSVLFVFKYLNLFCFTGASILNFFGLNVSFAGFNLILPVGISFYTFQTLSYVIDVYKEKVSYTKNIFIYAIYVTFFPQLVAGPIERPENLIPQLENSKSINSEDVSEGIKYLLTGFVKKIVIADYVATFVNTAFGSLSFNSPTYIIGALLFSIQIYCDFSGYTDIAIGAARLFGVKLSKNFDHPYLSKSVREFWSRWHISLTSWFTDYIYIPLGGNRKGLLRQCLNIMLVFLVSGFWHGARWNFVLWGVINGLLIVIETLFNKYRNKSKVESNIVNILKTCMTFLIISFTWIFFRAQSVNDAFVIISNIFTNFDGGFSAAVDALSLNIYSLIYILFLIAVLVFIDYIPKINFVDNSTSSLRYINTEAKKYGIYVLVVILIALSWLYISSINGGSGFIYFEF